MAATVEHVIGEYTLNATVKQIHFYRLEKGGKSFYLLGSNHGVSLAKFSKPALDAIEKILQQCSSFVCEGFRPPNTQELIQKYGYLRDPNDKKPYWIDELSSKEKEAVNSVLDAIKLRYNLSFENRDIQIGAIPLFIIDNVFDNSMDAEIQNKYRRENNFHALNDDDGDEPVHLSENEFTFHTIAELKPILDSHFFNPEHRAMYVQNQNQYFSGDPVFVDEDDVEDITGQNKAWFHQIKQLPNLQKETTRVVVVGCGHLYGGYGLLSLFEKAGFLLTRMNSEGEFNPVQIQNLLLQYKHTQNKNKVESTQPLQSSDVLDELKTVSDLKF